MKEEIIFGWCSCTFGGVSFERYVCVQLIVTILFLSGLWFVSAHHSSKAIITIQNQAGTKKEQGNVTNSVVLSRW